MLVTIEGIAVRSIATAIPSGVLDLTELGELYGKEEVERIIENTSTSKVRIAPRGVCTSDLCEKAALRILEENKKEVGGIVFVSQTPDYILPPTSILLQHRLGLSKEIVAFDINYGCSGYVYGLYQSALLINSGSCESVLLCAGDVITRFINDKDRSLRMLFGDAGSATIVERGSDKLTFSIMSDGSGANYLIIPAGGSRCPRSEATSQVSDKGHGIFRSEEDLSMEGFEVMKFALSAVPKMIEGVLHCRKWAKSEVGLFGLHQANKIILDYLIKKMQLPKEAVPISMGKTGNTGPASIPLMLSLEFKRLAEEKRLEKTILCGFGTGLSCAAVALNLSQTKMFDPIPL